LSIKNTLLRCRTIFTPLLSRLKRPSAATEVLIMHLAMFLAAAGFFAVWDFSEWLAVSKWYDPSNIVKHQAVSLLLGIALMLFLSRFSGWFHRLKWGWATLGGIVLLIALTSSIMYGGAKRCIHVFGFSFRTGHLAILLILPLLCKQVAQLDKDNGYGPLSMLQLLIAGVTTLLLLQPDLPMIFLFIIMAGSLLLSTSASIRKKGIVLAALIFSVALSSYRLSQINQSLYDTLFFVYHRHALWNISDTIMSYHCQAHCAFQEIISSGFFGYGWGTFRFAKAGQYSMEVLHTFILQVIGKETGTVGTLLVITLLETLILLMLFRLRSVTDSYRKKFMFGITLFLAIPTITGIGRTFEVMTYLPAMQIPFLGYGPAGNLVYFAALGLFLYMAEKDRQDENKKSKCIGEE
jgi:cell division protein FtsW (lipid II flippase)